MTNWKVFKTAPKDGTPVLLYFEPWSCVSGGAHRGVWTNGKWWMQGHHCGGELGEWPLPTHWMPLPDPPRASSGGRAT